MVKAPDCRSRGRWFDSAYRSLDNLVHLTLPMSFGRDGKTTGLSSLASIPGETKYIIQGVKVEDSKCGVLYNPLMYSFCGLKSDKMENPTTCIVILTRMSKWRRRLK